MLRLRLLTLALHESLVPLLIKVTSINLTDRTAPFTRAGRYLPMHYIATTKEVQVLCPDPGVSRVLSPPISEAESCMLSSDQRTDYECTLKNEN